MPALAELEECAETAPAVPVTAEPHAAPPPEASHPEPPPSTAAVAADPAGRRWWLSTPVCFGISILAVAAAIALGQVRALQSIAVLVGMAGAIVFLVATLA